LHLAGIIPVAGQALDFNMPWHDCLMPINKDYLAIERSVVECAAAGANTIWIVCNDDMQPLIRYRLGDYAQDPVYVNRSFERHRSEHQRVIPIYYVPIHARDRNKRDCLGWSVLYGAWTASRITSALSAWLKSEKYYVSFPYGVYNPFMLRDFRKNIRADKRVVLSKEDKKVFNNEYLGFTFDHSDYLKLKEEVKVKSTGLFRDEERTSRLSIDERFSYRFFELNEVFESLDDDYETIEVEEYHNIGDWRSYTKFLSSAGDKFNRPKSIINYKEWNGMGIDEH